MKTRNTRKEVRQLVDVKGDILKTKDGLVSMEMDYGSTFNLQSSKNTQTEIMHNPTSVRVSLFIFTSLAAGLNFFVFHHNLLMTPSTDSPK